MNLDKRIEKIEEKLNINSHKKPPLVLRILLNRTSTNDEAKNGLPENVEEWLTYQEQLRQNCTLILVNERDELEARRRLQKVT